MKTTPGDPPADSGPRDPLAGSAIATPLRDPRLIALEKGAVDTLLAALASGRRIEAYREHNTDPLLAQVVDELCSESVPTDRLDRMVMAGLIVPGSMRVQFRLTALGVQHVKRAQSAKIRG